MGSRYVKFTISLIFSVFVLSNTYAEIYKSRDADGNVYYSNNPVSNNAEKITLDPAPALSAIQEKQQRQANARAEADQKETTATKQQKAQALVHEDYQEQLNKACQRYRNNLALLKEKGRRVYTVSPEGEYHYLSEDERQQQIATTQHNIDMFCSSVTNQP